MGEAIGALLPLAVGVALSPVPIIAVILMLGTPRAGTTGTSFAAGWMFGLTAVATVVALVASGADDPDSGPSTAVGIVKLALGVLFLALAIVQWRKRPAPGEAPEMPRWMQSIDRLTPLRAAGFGALLSGANPKNLALTVAASASVAEGGLGGGSTAVALAIFVIVGSLTVVGPVMLYLVARTRAAAKLEAVKQFLSAHNATIMMVVLVILAAKLIGDGIGGLSG